MFFIFAVLCRSSFPLRYCKCGWVCCGSIGECFFHLRTCKWVSFSLWKYNEIACAFQLSIWKAFTMMNYSSQEWWQSGPAGCNSCQRLLGYQSEFSVYEHSQDKHVRKLEDEYSFILYCQCDTKSKYFHFCCLHNIKETSDFNSDDYWQRKLHFGSWIKGFELLSIVGATVPFVRNVSNKLQKPLVSPLDVVTDQKICKWNCWMIAD